MVFENGLKKKARRSGTKAAAWSFKGIRHVVEGRGKVCANQLYGGDDDHRNASGNESVLDCSRPGLVLEEIREKLIHCDKSFLLSARGKPITSARTYSYLFHYSCRAACDKIRRKRNFGRRPE